jgi:hypothetical protein
MKIKIYVNIGKGEIVLIACTLNVQTKAKKKKKSCFLLSNHPQILPSTLKFSWPQIKLYLKGLYHDFDQT